MKHETPQNPPETSQGRRKFLKSAAAVFSAISLSSCSSWDGIEGVLSSRFKELDKDEIKALTVSWEKKYSEKYKVSVKVDHTPPMKDVQFGYGLDLSRCVGCRRCVYACVKENNQSRDPQIQWIRVLEMDKEKGVDLTHANPYYDAEQVPREGHFYMPVQCQQCNNPPCVKTCPVGATWKEPDGIVVIDYDWCIGCRCCMAACPYGARHFNWTVPGLEAMNMHLFDIKMPEQTEEEGKKYPERLNEKKLSNPLWLEFRDRGFYLPRKVKIEVKKKDHEWLIHDEEHRDTYLVVKDSKAPLLGVSEVYDTINPNTHYLGNRPRPKGVVEKCTFCIQRTRKGRYPACVEVCPVGARKFGNLLDPNSEIRKAIETKRVFIFKEELNTQPSFFYFYSL